MSEPASARVARLLGEVYVRADRAEAAEEAARHALALARKRQERGAEGRALRLLGDIAARRDPPDVPAAKALYGEALARLEPLGYRPDVARCRRALGRLLARTGRTREADAHLATAARMEHEMGIAAAEEAAADGAARG